MHRIGMFGALLLVATIAGCSLGDRATYTAADALPDMLRTHAERTQYAETGRYADIVDFCRRLGASSPYARYTTFGASGEGRPLPLLILSRDGSFTPDAARRDHKPLVLIINCIHPGECAGKDASLELARDILITGTRADMLAGVNILIIPILSPDGHERFSPYSRINQNGPREMGWRVTATNLNLNRDFAKADSVEMRAWLRLWNEWEPDLLCDDHTTNGSDHRYDLFYSATAGRLVAPPIAAWVRDVLYPGVLTPLAEAGWETLPYSWPRDHADIAAGVNAASAYTPRYSTGFGAACNRPAVLIEVHALKPYRQRVRVTYDFLRHMLATLNKSGDALLAAIDAADRDCIQTGGGQHDGAVPLRAKLTDTPRRIVYRGVVTRLRPSEVTGGEIIEYTDQPLDIETNIYEEVEVVASITPPAAYVVPPQWTAIIDRLALHGVEFFRLAGPVALDVESYRFEDVTFPEMPYESRHAPKYTTIMTRGRREFIAGSVVVPLSQRRAKLIVHLLEPDAPDSFVAWGLLNAIFERKEYAESYVMEPIARRMLADDPELRREFEELLATDEEFAGSPGRRLDFFYRRSPYYDEQYNCYPVARLADAEALRRLAAEHD